MSPRGVPRTPKEIARDALQAETADRLLARFDMRRMAEAQEYVEALSTATLHAFGYALDEKECAEWYEADVTVDDAVAFLNRGCGPGDASGWSSFEEAFPPEDEEES